MNRRAFLAILAAPLAAPFAAPLVIKRGPFKTSLTPIAPGASPIEDIEAAMKLIRARYGYEPERLFLGPNELAALRRTT